MQCLILAGGLGTRMRPHTATVPKALLPVAGRPFADWQLGRLASEGMQRVVYSVGHLGELVERHVGDGRRWNIDVRYVYERGRLLGTAGAIRRAIDAGAMDEVFFVLYGDSYLPVDLKAVEACFVECGLPALMTVFPNHGSWDASNVVYGDGRVVLYDKFATDRSEMHYIDYGLLVLRRNLIEEAVEPGEPADLAPILNALSRQGRLAGYEAPERFFEIGSPQGLRDLEEHLAAGREGARQRRPG